MEFWVTICLGYGDGGDVCIEEPVSEEERELLMECCREDMDMCDCEGLEDLCERIENAARDESECCGPEDDETDYDDASYMIAIPDEICDAVEAEEDQ